MCLLEVVFQLTHFNLIGAHYALEDLSQDDWFDVISLDWTIDPASARKRTLGNVTLQGNADPSLLYATDDTIKETVREMLVGFGPSSRYIGNLGHGKNTSFMFS